MDLASDSNPNFHSGGGAGVRFCSAGHDSGDAQDQAKLIDEAIADLTLWCTNLETLSVLGRHTGSVIPLMQMNPQLRSVTLTNCSKALRCINDLCPHIASIEIAECASVADLELFVLPSQLKRLALLDTCFDIKLLNAVAASTSLVELRLDILNFDWADLTTTCTCLSLQVLRCIVPVRQLHTKLIKKLSKVMPHLRTLILLCTNDDAQALVAAMLETILTRFPALRQLCSLRAFENKLSAGSLSPLWVPLAPLEPSAAAQAGALDGFVLQELYLNNTGYFPLGDTLSKCPVLHTLGLSCVYDEGSVAAQITKRLPASVKRVVCTSMQAASVHSYATFQGLYELDLSICTYLTDSALMGIAKNCPALTLLNIKHAPRVTLSGVLEVPKLCSQLRSLEFINNTASSNKNGESDAVAAVKKLCLLRFPQLQHIALVL